MAGGNPSLRHLSATIEKHEDEFWQHVAAGATARELAAICGVWGGRPPWERTMIYTWLHDDEDRDGNGGTRWAKFKRMRSQAAHVLAEDSLEILDSASPATISVDRERARTRQWMAERYNRAELGDTKQIGVQLNIGQLHLEALQTRPARTPQATEVQRVTAQGDTTAVVDAPGQTLLPPPVVPVDEVIAEVVEDSPLAIEAKGS